MSRRKGKLKLGGAPLPEQLTGHKIICLTIPVPDDPIYIAAVVGAITELWEWQRWDKTGEPGDTRATEAAQYFRNIQSGKFRYGKCPDYEDCECGDCESQEECDECGDCY